jgi:hypothetical protein
MEDIIQKYKKYSTFVIVRNINGLLHVNINEEYTIKKKYDLIESINFLEKYKNVIDKIFVNHLLGHNSVFIEKIFNLGKEVTGITHDYYNLIKNPTPFYHEIEDYLKKKEYLYTKGNTKKQLSLRVPHISIIIVKLFKEIVVFYELVRK